MSMGILLVNLGTPDAPTANDVKRYLAEFLSDYRVVSIPKLFWLPLLYGIILPIRSKKTAENYKKIWMDDGSPLLVYSQRIAKKLNGNVKLAMRYGNPSVEQAIKAFAEDKITKLVVLPMYPQYSTSTTASVYDAVDALAKKYLPDVDISRINNYAENEHYINALCHSINSHWQQHGRADKLVLSYHGLPERLIRNGDPYQQQCYKTTELIVKQLDLKDDEWEQVFQSRFGFEKWLQPYCVKRLEALPDENVKSIDIVCPGFSVDCLETLEEIAETNSEIFIEAGGEKYRYIAALNDDDVHVDALNTLIKDAIQ